MQKAPEAAATSNAKKTRDFPTSFIYPGEKREFSLKQECILVVKENIPPCETQEFLIRIFLFLIFLFHFGYFIPFYFHFYVSFSHSLLTKDKIHSKRSNKSFSPTFQHHLLCHVSVSPPAHPAWAPTLDRCLFPMGQTVRPARRLSETRRDGLDFQIRVRTTLPSWVTGSRGWTPAGDRRVVSPC